MRGYQDINLSRVLTVAAIMLVTFQTWWLFFFINRYAVNVLFYDHWDLYNAFFTPHSPWEIFTWQHGPHRQGLGSFLILAINEWTGWDQKIHSIAIGIAMVLAAGAFLLLKWRLFRILQWYDSIPVLMILSTKQWEIFAGTPNISHGALPLLLLLLYCIAWTIETPSSFKKEKQHGFRRIYRLAA
ncbi:MAG: hypothetical protein JW768_05875 [Chitinispirillaceae bacterium]|nr:hypothetical protein [Chitinispirillaceae bacterium]